MRKEEELCLRRMRDLADQALRYNLPVFSDFLTETEQHLIQTNLQALGHIEPEWFGGSLFAERKIAGFFPEGALHHMEAPLCILHISPKSTRFGESLTHRDFLGAIMNLGLNRDVVGDIFPGPDSSAYIVCKSEIGDYILKQLGQVRHTPVNISRTDHVPEECQPRTEELCISVASLRLDAVVAQLTKTSRQGSMAYFQAGKVFLNGMEVRGFTRPIRDGEQLTIRGKGKFVFRGISHMSKSGKYVLTWTHYIS